MVDLNEVLEPGDLRDKLGNYGITTVEQLADVWNTTQKKYDSSIRVPQPDASIDEVSAYYKKIGVPDSSSGYQLAAEVADTPVGKVFDALRDIAHKEGIPGKTWDAMAQKAQEANQQVVKSQQDHFAAVKESFQQMAKEQLGTGYDQAVVKAQDIVAKIAGEDSEVQQVLDSVGLTHHPELLKLFSTVSEITEPTSTPETVGGSAMNKDPVSEAREIAHNMRQLALSDEYRVKNNPGHKLAMEKFMTMSEKLANLGYAGCTDPALSADS